MFADERALVGTILQLLYHLCSSMHELKLIAGNGIGSKTITTANTTTVETGHYLIER